MRIKVTLILIIYLITLSSCKTQNYREKFSYYFDLSEQLLFLESNIINSDKNDFTIEIRFGHNSINLLKSDFKVSADNVRIKTVRETNNKKIVDTTFILSKKLLLDEIEFQKNNTKDMIVLAGHYQTMKISRGDKIINYPTIRVAGYLINFLETGENHH
ncbi:MAG: hypothetical protein ACI9Y7_001705 [Dokdonia sp.]|jgi:hypothetical protein